jgi:hypothetical protein
MSNERKYTAEEVARMIADRAAEVMKKHEISSEYFEQILEKSKNTAHEIDNGEEPNNEDAECPPSLCESGGSEKSESSEDASMEDEPLQGDNDSDTEEEETEEDEDEDEEDEYEFVKSEACGHTIEYKRLAKRCWEGYEPTPGKKAYAKGSCQKKSEDELSEEQKEKMDTDKDGDIDAKDLKNLRHAKKSENNIKFKHSNEAGQQTDQSDAQQAVSGIKRKASLEDQSEYKKQKRHRMNVDRAEGGKTYGKKSSRVEDKGIEARVEGRRSTKTPEYTGPERRSKQRVRGEGHVYKKSESDKISEQEMQTQMPSRKTFPKASENNKKKKISEQEMQTQMPSRKTFKSESGMFTVEYNRLEKARIDEGLRGKQKKKARAERNEGFKPHVKETIWNSSKRVFHDEPKAREEYIKRMEEKKEKTKFPSKENLEYPMAASEDSKVKETEGIEFDKKQDADKTKEEKKGVKRPLEKCGEIKKEEMDKCGEMSSGKKLKKFMKKNSESEIKTPNYEGSDRRKNNGRKGFNGRKIKSKEVMYEKRKSQRIRGRDRLPKVPHFLRDEE